MLAEQVWDEADCPERDLYWADHGFGHAAGVGARRYLKLLRSALDGKVFDRVEAVYERYSEPAGRKRARRDLESTRATGPSRPWTPARLCAFSMTEILRCVD